MDAKEAEVECPCCGSRILFDVRTSKVVRWNRGRELDESGRPKVSEEDWASANARVKGRLDSAADKLDAGLSRERNREKDLDDLFRKASEKMKRPEEDAE